MERTMNAVPIKPCCGECQGCGQIRRLDSGALFRGDKLLVIEHSEQRYYLRITKSGKLILTK